MKGSLRYGYTLTEILLTLSLLGVFAFVATRLFGSSFKVMSESAQASENTMRFDAAVKLMRDEVGSSASIESPKSTLLILDKTGDKTIQWESDNSSQLSRTEQGESRSWDVGEAIDFRREGALVLIHPSDSIEGTADIAMASNVEPKATK